MKKPNELTIESKDTVLSVYEDRFEEKPDHVNVDINCTFYNDSFKDTREMRKISAWLKKAADYMDFKSGVRGLEKPTKEDPVNQPTEARSGE